MIEEILVMSSACQGVDGVIVFYNISEGILVVVCSVLLRTKLDEHIIHMNSYALGYSEI